MSAKRVSRHWSVCVGVRLMTEQWAFPNLAAIVVAVARPRDSCLFPVAQTSATLGALVLAGMALSLVGRPGSAVHLPYSGRTLV